MNRRTFVAAAAVLMFAFSSVQAQEQSDTRLHRPANGKIRVAVVLSEDAVMIDFAGPWEVFQDVMLSSSGTGMDHPFELYTVADSKTPIRVSDGMIVVPSHSFEDAPAPQIVVVPAQSGRSAKMLAWLRTMSKQSEVVMSVCTGAFVLADAGLLNGKHATTHHGAYAQLAKQFPQITVERDMRYVRSDPVIFTAGGLSSGIDLALHIVELYFGHEVASETANHLEYEGRGWMGSGAASVHFSSAHPPLYPSDSLHDGVLGRWEGAFRPQDGGYHVVLHIWRNKGGKLVGAFDSVDQSAFGLQLNGVTVKGDKLTFGVPEVMGTFEGSMQAAAIHGTWKQHDASVRLDLARVSASR